MDEFSKLSIAEREITQAVRDAEIEIQEILEQRRYEEQNVVILRPYSDIGKYTVDPYKDEEDATKVLFIKTTPKYCIACYRRRGQGL